MAKMYREPQELGCMIHNEANVAERADRTKDAEKWEQKMGGGRPGRSRWRLQVQMETLSVIRTTDGKTAGGLWRFQLNGVTQPNHCGKALTSN